MTRTRGATARARTPNDGLRRLLGLLAIGRSQQPTSRAPFDPGGDPGRPASGPIDSRVEIDAPLDLVWQVLSDIQGQPRWMHEMKGVELLTPGPVGIGTRGTATIRILGVSVADPVEVVEWDPPHAYAIRHDGQFGGGGRLTATPGLDGTTTIVEWHETLVPPFLPHLGALLQRPVLGWIFQNDLYHLRDLVEGLALESATG